LPPHNLLSDNNGLLNNNLGRLMVYAWGSNQCRLMHPAVNVIQTQGIKILSLLKGS
jgi:hypothetical protein